MEQQKRNKTKIIIIVLAVLLALSLTALAGTLIYNKLTGGAGTTVTVPDNLITPDGDTQGNDTNTPNDEDAEGETSITRKAASISLYNRQTEDNTAFAAGNMFPGDRETKYFRVQVSYHDTVTVHYHADIRPGYEKLAQVLKVRIRLLTAGEGMYDSEVMYNGLMRDMPESLFSRLNSSEQTVDELYYEITAYLDTSVGNEYQNRDLIADFRWWAEETGNLGPAPTTGDTSGIILPAVFVLASGTACILLITARKRKEDNENV